MLLTGEVPTEADKQTAEQIVLRVENVGAVVNELAVGRQHLRCQRSSDTLLSPARSRPLVDAKDLYRAPSRW